MHASEKWKWSRSVVSNSSRSHGLQPTRLLHPWDFPGKSTGVGCHCLLWWIEQWSLKREKLEALHKLLNEQLSKGHIIESFSPWNSPVVNSIWQMENAYWFESCWCCYCSLMGALQPDLPNPNMIPRNWHLLLISKIVFFLLFLHTLMISLDWTFQFFPLI